MSLNSQFFRITMYDIDHTMSTEFIHMKRGINRGNERIVLGSASNPMHAWYINDHYAHFTKFQ